MYRLNNIYMVDIRFPSSYKLIIHVLIQTVMKQFNRFEQDLEVLKICHRPFI